MSKVLHLPTGFTWNHFEELDITLKFDTMVVKFLDCHFKRYTIDCRICPFFTAIPNKTCTQVTLPIEQFEVLDE